MSYWILTESGNVISCTTVQQLSNLEQQTDEWKMRMKSNDDGIKERMGAMNTEIHTSHDAIQTGEFLDINLEDKSFIQEFTCVIDNNELRHADDVARHEDNQYVGMELDITQGEGVDAQSASVKPHKLDNRGVPAGMAYENQILNTRQYEVEYSDGTSKVLLANVVAENLLAQVDKEGHRQVLLDEIVSHQKDSMAIPRDKGTFKTKTGLLQKKRTTRRWAMH